MGREYFTFLFASWSSILVSLLFWPNSCNVGSVSSQPSRGAFWPLLMLSIFFPQDNWQRSKDLLPKSVIGRSLVSEVTGLDSCPALSIISVTFERPFSLFGSQSHRRLSLGLLLLCWWLLLLLMSSSSDFLNRPDQLPYKIVDLLGFSSCFLVIMLACS